MERDGRQSAGPEGADVLSGGGSIAFAGRPIDLAMHPKEDTFAILHKSSVLLATAGGVIEGAGVPLGASAGFRGLAWSPNGS